MAVKSESFGLKVGTGHRAWRRDKGSRKVLSAIREWSSSMHVGPSRSAEVGRHTGARI